MADDCSFIDEQKLKLQEAPEEVPTGEMPRSIELSVERYLVDKCPPGTRVEVMGISSLSGPGQQKGGTSTVRLPYLRVVGININTEGSGRVSEIIALLRKKRCNDWRGSKNIREISCIYCTTNFTG